MACVREAVQAVQQRRAGARRRRAEWIAQSLQRCKRLLFSDQRHPATPYRACPKSRPVAAPNPHAASRTSGCWIALQQGLQANQAVVQRGQDHFAISHRTCMFCQSATRSIAVLRPLQSTASVIVASASAASLRSVRRLQRCAQWAPQQVGGHSPAGVAAARRRPREREN